MNVRTWIILGLAVLLVVSFACNIIQFIGQRRSTSRIADLETGMAEFAAENKRLEKLIEGFEGERSEIYRRFEEAISGAEGHAGRFGESLDRLDEIHSRIRN